MSNPVQGAPLPATPPVSLDLSWWSALPGFDVISSLLDFIKAQVEAVEHVARVAEDYLAFNHSEPTLEPLRKKRLSSPPLPNLVRHKRTPVSNETLRLVERTIPIIMDLLSPPILPELYQELSLKPNVTVTDRNQTGINNDSKWSKEQLQDLAILSLIVAICLGAALVAGIALRCFDEVRRSTEDSPLPDSSSLSHSYVSILPWRWNLSTPALPEEEHIYEVMAGGRLSSIKETP